MFSFLKRQSVVPPPAPEPKADDIKRQAADARYFAEELLKEHVRNQSLNKLSKESVRNAMRLAHALHVACEAYERELRAEALRTSLETEQFHPEERLEEIPADA